MRLSLSMVTPSDRNPGELHGVVLRADSCGREQEPQNLRIGLCGPASQGVQQQEDQQAAREAVEEVERGGAKTHGTEKEFSLGPENCQRPRQRPEDFVDSSAFVHMLFASNSTAGK